MAHSIPPQIKLLGKFNKTIKPSKDTVEGGLPLASRDRSTYSIEGKVLDKPIQVYRMWYRFLQLALELESQKVSIVTKMKKVPLPEKKRDIYGHWRYHQLVPMSVKVKVNRKKYDAWDIDLIPTTSFDEWWFGKKGGNYRAHREIFYPDRSTVVLKKKDEWISNPNFTYIRVDKRRRINDIVADVRDLFAEADRKPESVSSFPIIGMPNINTLINRYNALVLQLTSKETDEEMFKSGIFRNTTWGMVDGKKEDQVGVYKVGSSMGRTMRDLIFPAKISLLSVCDGYFVKHPNKEYTDD